MVVVVVVLLVVLLVVLVVLVVLMFWVVLVVLMGGWFVSRVVCGVCQDDVTVTQYQLVTALVSVFRSLQNILITVATIQYWSLCEARAPCTAS